MQWPCWFRIVIDPKLRRGPTIPFILGVCRDPLSAAATPELAESDLRRLLTAMRDATPKPYSIEILRCPDLKTYVASACIDPPTGRVRIQSPDDPSCAVYSCDKIGEHDVRDLDSLVVALWATRANHTVKGRFSRHGGKWRHLDDSDLENIRVLRGNPSPGVPPRLQQPFLSRR